jgi:sulfocyanin
MGSITLSRGKKLIIGGMALSTLALSNAGLGATLARTGTAQAAATPTWVTTTGKTVHLTLIAAWNNTNAGFNFNGAAHGQMTVTVPLGDTVDASFKNEAQGAMHDVVVIPYTQTLPASAATPAFSGAASPAASFAAGGSASGSASQSFSFVAGKAGRYLLVCGVAGHAIAGMWDNLVVSPAAKTASVSFGAAGVVGAAGTTAAPANPNQWVSTSGKVVHLTLIAGYNSANAGFNFDGGARGQMVVTVPLGDKIVGTFKNDATTPHDVLIVPYQKTLPTHSVPAAFSGACYGSPVCGSGGSGGAGGAPGAGGPPKGGAPGAGGPPTTSNTPHTFTFTAGKAGTYMIICGYPGHAIAGMWDTFVVSPTAKAATITFK